MADSRLLADQLLAGLGGADNIVDVENCMTSAAPARGYRPPVELTGGPGSTAGSLVVVLSFIAGTPSSGC